ncbi:MAG: adenine-specific methyltransferase EcoRI family protein [Paludibacteraceae bacterium]|nr:adenine-specific methyltransferase EcoRI family protein [Paludibacteraceae bacterium]
MAGNSNLHAANKAKKDEFYTQLSDIANELKPYKQHFAGKTVFCNCDDPYESNFFKYFALNFNVLGLKKLIATCYNGSPVADTQMCLFEPDEPYGKPQKTRVPHKIVITEVPDANGDGATDLTDVEWLLKNDKNVLTTLQGNGDFRSKECIELLKEADIVVTNPPFSLFREYVAQLVQYDKKFLIIGNKNAITYKECFKLIRDNKLWIGVTPMSVDLVFDIPGEYSETIKNTKKQGSGYRIVDGVLKARAQAIWFTNLDHNKRHEFLDLYKKYSPEEYPRYENYDAIEVSKTANIPADYSGYMGVPITFMDKYNPDQFELIGMGEDNGTGYSGGVWLGGSKSCLVNGKAAFKRLFIRKKQ